MLISPYIITCFLSYLALALLVKPKPIRVAFKLFHLSIGRVLITLFIVMNPYLLFAFKLPLALCNYVGIVFYAIYINDISWVCGEYT